MPNLKLICTRSTGYDHIDIEHAKLKGIKVCNVPEYGSNTVAEHTFGLMLCLSHKIFESILQLKNPDFSHKNLMGTDIVGKTLGILGLGKIGIKVAQIAKGFGMNVLVCSRSQKIKPSPELNFTYVDFDYLIANSDVVTLHLPLNSQTHHTINNSNILKFKKGSFIINTARGGLIQTESLVLGLTQGVIDGVALDVLEDEKELTDEVQILNQNYNKESNLQNIVYNNMLLHHPKVIITPHNAFNSEQALARILETTHANIANFLSNTPSNCINC